MGREATSCQIIASYRPAACPTCNVGFFTGKPEGKINFDCESIKLDGMNKKVYFDKFNHSIEINLARFYAVNSPFITMFPVYAGRYSLSKTNAVFPPTKVSKLD